MLFYFEYHINNNKIEIVEANFDNLRRVCHPSYDGWPTFGYYPEYRVVTDSPCYMHKGNLSKPNYVWVGLIDASSVEEASKTIRKMLEDYNR